MITTTQIFLASQFFFSVMYNSAFC